MDPSEPKDLNPNPAMSTQIMWFEAKLVEDPHKVASYRMDSNSMEM